MRAARIGLLAILASVALPGASQTKTPIRGPLVATFEVDREHVYAGETFSLFFSVYSDGPEISKDLQLNGLPDGRQLTLRPFSRPLTTEARQIGNRRQIRRYRVKAVAPQPGVIRLAPQLVATVVRRSQGLFSALRFNSVKIPVIPTVLTIQAVPEAGRPRDYSGVIGRPSFDVVVDSVEPAPGDLVTITMRVTSPDTLPEFDPPAVSLDEHFKAYPTRTLPDEDPGVRRFEKIIIPLSTNAHTIPPIRFSYFDTEQRAYQLIERGPFGFTFTKRREVKPDRTAVYSGTRAPEEVVTVDTVPIPPEQWSHPPRPIHQRKGFWAIQAIPIAIYFGISMVARRRPGASASRGALLLVTAILAVTLSYASQTTDSTAAQAFAAHQGGDFRKASKLYEASETTGVQAPELFYNLGSVHYLAGRLGQAVLYYARAYRLDPRNESFRTNLSRTTTIAGVPQALVFQMNSWHRFHLNQWTLGAVAAYWIFMTAAGLRRAVPHARIFLSLACALLLVSGAVSAYGAWNWQDPSNLNQAIVLEESKVRFGPMRSARIQFPLREGSAVELLESHADWIKIDANGNRGWIEQSAVERVAL